MRRRCRSLALPLLLAGSDDGGGSNEVRHPASMSAWHEISCAHGCPELLEEVAHVLHKHSGQWGVLLVHDADNAPVAQIGALAKRFFHAGRCFHSTADARFDSDCRRFVFALSTRWGTDATLQPDARARPRHELTSLALAEAQPWLTKAVPQVAQRQRLRGAMAVVLGREPSDRFATRILEQDQARAKRAARRDAARAAAATAAPERAGRRRQRSRPLSIRRGLRPGGCVRELRSRLSVVASGADGGEGAHVFFFFGFPGTGKTYLAEQVAMAQHGSTAKPNYEVFSMQNYKTEEAMWNLVSPPCGVKGEGAFANLFASRVGCGGGGGGGTCEGVAPVVLFDEIEEARADFMTTALVNAVDKKGYVEFHRKEAGSDRCQSVHAPTAGAFFILTSNCFMDELNAVLADEQRPGRTPAQVYAAVRKAMDAKIFDEGIPCDNATRTPSPFAARKMADRMRGNIYPFLPLNDEEVVRAFETQLQHRADAYEATRGVGLYWTRGLARLIGDKALDGGDGGGGAQRCTRPYAWLGLDARRRRPGRSRRKGHHCANASTTSCASTNGRSSASTQRRPTAARGRAAHSSGSSSMWSTVSHPHRPRARTAPRPSPPTAEAHRRRRRPRAAAPSQRVPPPPPRRHRQRTASAAAAPPTSPPTPPSTQRPTSPRSSGRPGGARPRSSLRWRRSGRVWPRWRQMSSGGSSSSSPRPSSPSRCSWVRVSLF